MSKTIITPKSANFVVYSKFVKLIDSVIYEMTANKVFQPIGLELSLTPIEIQTTETYGFREATSEMNIIDLPIAYYNPQEDTICVYVQHPLFLARTEEEQKALFFFLLYHEASHRLLMHTERCNGKDHELWNVAGDLEIHNMLWIYKECVGNATFKQYLNHINGFLFERTLGNLNCGLFEKDLLNYTAEEIYHKMNNGKKTVKKSFSIAMPNGSDGNGNGNGQSDSNDSDENQNQPNGNKPNGNKPNGGKPNGGNGNSQRITITKTEYTLPSGQKITHTSYEFPDCKSNQGSGKDGDPKDDLEQRKTRKAFAENAMRNALNDAVSKGNCSESCRVFLDKLFKVKIDWSKILQNALKTALQKTDCFTWAKPRTSLFGLPQHIYLPSILEDESGLGTLVIARDESGSISHEDCCKAVNVIMRCKEDFKKLVVLKHDTEITETQTFEDELSEDDVKSICFRTSGGGTSHKEVFEYIANHIENYGGDDPISAIIMITDMYSDIETYQDDIPESIPIFYLTPMGNRYNSSRIRGMVIEMED